eukprot:TRINITY_DN3592_c0_g3_i4.p1 TRINITY_DN3592_c0_g3~~TRINITY_DN3592_c0_g3_i4.p1  ORF type:complete len:153 (+),score=31.93 TRINITY_DN3592_c0_g3_i4:480-938(+)
MMEEQQSGTHPEEKAIAREALRELGELLEGEGVLGHGEQASFHSEKKSVSRPPSHSNRSNRPISASNRGERLVSGHSRSSISHRTEKNAAENYVEELQEEAVEKLLGAGLDSEAGADFEGSLERGPTGSIPPPNETPRSGFAGRHYAQGLNE